MAKKNRMVDESLLNLPLIDGMVMDIRGQETYRETPRKESEQANEIRQEGTEEYSISDSWNHFLFCAKKYDYRVRKTNRKNYRIDNSIVSTLQKCDVNRMSVEDMINAILHSFIEEHKEQLAKVRRPEDSLI